MCYNGRMTTFQPDFSRYGKKINEEFGEKFTLFRRLLLEYNQKFNLTAITDEKEIFYKHFLDSVAGEELFPFQANVCEIGSGAGFPSIPLKIIRGDLNFTLVESTGKKCDFLRIAVEKLALDHVIVIQARAEDVGKGALRETFDISCARAVAALNTLTEYCLPLVKIGGRMIAYKGGAEEEIIAAKKAIAVLGGGKTQIHRYALPEQTGERSLVVVEKGKSTPEKYPRGNGKERSRPII